MAIHIEKRALTTTPVALGLEQNDVDASQSIIITPTDGDIRLLHDGASVLADGFPVASGSAITMEFQRGEEIFLAADAGTVNVHIMASGI